MMHNHGGKRDGAGAKPLPPGMAYRRRTFCANDSQWIMVLKMGGSKWLRKLIDDFTVNIDDKSNIRGD